MTSKEKAQELILKFVGFTEECVYPKSHKLKEFKHNPNIENAIQCAIMCIDEIIETHTHKNIIGLGGYNSEHTINFWKEVKEQVESP